jgi:hypothetical protein
VSPAEAGRVVSQHLGVEMFEPMVDASKGSWQSESFVGMGQKSSLLVSLEATDLQGVPAAIVSSFVNVNTYSECSCYTWLQAKPQVCNPAACFS